MKKLLFIVVVALFAQYAWNDLGLQERFAPSASVSDAALAEAFESQRGDLQIGGSGVVIRILPDDDDGSRHQRFILQLNSGQTVLVAHNIDLAPRAVSLAEGDVVEFYGEYEWNEKGGVIHWTHKDPNGAHEGGWIKHDGKTYQ